VLSIDQGNGQLPSCRLGSSASLRAGEWVIAMGSPIGMSNTLTAGIISCVDRKAVELGLAGVGAGEYIQTDASINRGSSGGPLVNLAGEVVGVSCMKAVAADGVSFHIPIDAAREVVAQLLDRGRVIRPFIGVKLLQLNALNLAQIRRRDSTFPEDVKDGVLVPHIKPGSPAEKAGLQQGDVIVSYEGVSSGEKATTAGLIRALSEHVGKPLELRVMRPRSSEEKESAQGGGRRGCALVTIRVVAEEASQQQQQQHLLQQQHGFQSRPV
jgi:HtrA serine peptidase 2